MKKFYLIKKLSDISRTTIWMLAFILLNISVSHDAQAVVRYVKAGSTGTAPYTSWATADGNLLTVINYCSTGDTIWVAAGTYQPPMNSYFYLKEGVKIFGGFIGTETSIGQRNWAANITTLKGNGKKVIYNTSYNGLTQACELDGFVIRDGIGQCCGGGMLNEYCSPTIRNCIFRDNHANSGGATSNYYCAPKFINCTFENNTAAFGGAIYCFAEDSIEIIDCKFTNNHAGTGSGGGIENLGGISKIINCTFVGNTSGFFGGAIRNSGDSPLISGCSFSDNSAGSRGGAISGVPYNNLIIDCQFYRNTAEWGGAIYSDYNNIIENCIFRDNTASQFGGGVFVAQMSYVKIVNSVFDANTADHGGAIAIKINSMCDLVNCTLSNNVTDTSGVIFTADTSNLIVRNSIIFGNNQDIFTDNTSTTTTEYSLVQGIHDNTNGNIDGDTDPLFTDASDPRGPDDEWRTSDDGYILQLSSPALNSGNNADISGYNEDLKGDPRISGGNVDMGAYETTTFDPMQELMQDPLPVCLGEEVTFTITHQQGTPVIFSFFHNGIQVQAGLDATYQTSSYADGDTIVAFGYYQESSGEFYDTLYVSALPVPNATATPSLQTICSGSSIQSIVLSGNISGTTYSWTRNNTVNVTGIPASGNGSIISGALTNTTYTIQTVTFNITPTANGCVGTPITATVTVNPTPDVTPSPVDQEPCSGKSITPITMSGNVSGTTYLWTRDMPQITGIAMSGSGTISGTLYNIGSTQVTVTFTITPWANGCPGLPKTATVTVYPLPHAQAEAAPNPACEGELTWFNATGGVQYHWSGPGGFTFDGGRFGRHMELNMAGTYFVTVTSSHGCTSTASVTVSVKPAPVPTISISPNPACTGNTVQLSATGGVSYKWSGPFGFTSTQQNPTITNAKLYHSGTYSVTVTGANSCTASISMDLKVNETPVGKAWFDVNSACAGSTLQLYADGGGTYQWTGPAGFSSTLQNPTRPNLNATHSGIYTVVITGLYGGCTSSYSVNVQVHPLPTVTAWTTTPEVCEGDAAYLFASGAASYDWVGPYGYHSTFQNPIIYNIPMYMDGIYTVTGASEYGCKSSASVYIDVQSVNAIVNATPNPVPYGGTLYLTASGGTFYQWTGPNGFHTNFQNPIIYKFTQVNAGLYTCVVSTSAGCQDTEIILVQVKNNSAQDEPLLETRSGKYVQIFPNPAKDVIRLDDHYTGTMKYTIIDAQGNTIQQGKTTSGDQIAIDQLNAGSYYIQWTYSIDGKLQSNISKFIKVN